MSEEAKLLAHKERIDRVVAYIHANLDAPLDMEALGEIACLSPHHWHRIYREIMGETASQTIRRRRLWRAAHQLLHSAKKIEEIASAAHYGSVAAFTRAFTSEYGSSPAQYRAKEKDRQMANTEKRSIDPIDLIGMDHKGPHYEIGRTFDRLFAWAVTTEGMITPETKGIAVFFDNPTEKPPEELTSLAAIPRPTGTTPGNETRAYTIPGGPHAVARHIGPYTELEKTYAELFNNWLPTSGEARNGDPIFEINLNDPKTTAPSYLITDIYVPLA